MIANLSDQYWWRQVVDNPVSCLIFICQNLCLPHLFVIDITARNVGQGGGGGEGGKPNLVRNSLLYFETCYEDK